jgi:hypothetical protein
MAVKVSIVVFWVVMLYGLADAYNTSEKYITSIFRAEIRTEAIHSSKTLVATYKTIQHHNPEDNNQDVNIIKLLYSATNKLQQTDSYHATNAASHLDTEKEHVHY